MTLIREDGRTTCCNACTSIGDDEVEYCKACYEGVDDFAENYPGVGRFPAHTALCTQDVTDPMIVLLREQLNDLRVDHRDALCWCALMNLINDVTRELENA